MSLGLTNWFTPTCQSYQLILRLLFRQWQDISFLTIWPFQPLLPRVGVHSLRARHILGCLSVIAGRLSRSNQPITTDWSLHSEIATWIFELWRFLTVDMFATVHNAQLPQFMSRICFFNQGTSQTGSRTICTRGGSHAALPSSRIYRVGL